MNKEDIESRLKEIEDLQNKFEEIFIKKNFIIKLINLKRACDLLLLTQRKIDELEID